MQAGMQRAKAAVKGFGKDIKNSTSNMRLFAAVQGGVGGQLSMVSAQMEGVAGTFSALNKGIGKAIPGLGRLKVALVSTGIGAIVVALGALVAAFLETQEGMDIVAKAGEILGSVFANIMDTLGFLGKALIKLFKGDFAGASKEVEKAKEAFTSIVDDAGKASEIADKQVALEEKRLKYMTEIGELARDEGALREKAKDSERYSAQERAKFINEELALAQRRHSLNAELRQDEIDILTERQALSENTRADNAELVNLTKAHNEALDKEARNLKETRDIGRVIRKEAAKDLEVQKQRTIELEAQRAALDAIATGSTIQPKMAALPEGITSDDIDFSLEIPLQPFKDAQDEIDRVKERLEQAGHIKDSVFGDAALSISEALGLSTAIEDVYLFTEALEGAGDRMVNTLSQGAESFSEYADNAANMIRTVISGLISQGIAAAVTNALSNPALALAPWMIPVVAAAAGGLAQTAFNTLIPAFANGGIVSGPTMAMVGEYPGASNNPEVIAPLSKLQGMLNIGNGNSSGQMRQTIVLRGEDLHVTLEEYNRRKNNSFG